MLCCVVCCLVVVCFCKGGRLEVGVVELFDFRASSLVGVFVLSNSSLSSTITQE